MPLSASALEGLIISELQGQGFTTGGEHAFAQKMAKAIANAVVTHLKADAIIIPGPGGTDQGTAGAGMITPAKIS